MQNQLNKLKQHLRICKLIILTLITIIILQALPNNIEVLNSSIELDKSLQIEAVKLHQLEEYYEIIGESKQ